jgi:hypothetical protein
VLYYAEYFKCRALWIDSFCHCVGMASTIGASSEYKVGPITICCRVVSSPNNIPGYLGQHKTSPRTCLPRHGVTYIPHFPIPQQLYGKRFSHCGSWSSYPRTS